jgi:hypothetical protein
MNYRFSLSLDTSFSCLTRSKGTYFLNTASLEKTKADKLELKIAVIEFRYLLRSKCARSWAGLLPTPWWLKNITHKSFTILDWKIGTFCTSLMVCWICWITNAWSKEYYLLHPYYHQFDCNSFNWIFKKPAMPRTSC